MRTIKVNGVTLTWCEETNSWNFETDNDKDAMKILDMFEEKYARS